jgi:putative transcriptional regulator
MKNDVRELRQSLGYSQAELAEMIHVSRQTINAIETGRYSPSLPLAIRLARFLGRTVEEIFHVDENTGAG